MKKLVVLLAIFSIFASACGSKPTSSTSDASPSSSPAPTTKTIASVAPSPEPSPSLSTDKSDSKGVEIDLLGATYYPDDSTVAMQFDLKNGSDSSIHVSSLDFFLITFDGEILETALSPLNSSSRTIAKGGMTKGYRMAFKVDDPSNVKSFAFGKKDQDIFVQIMSDKFPPLEVFGQQQDNGGVPAGGGVKADNFQN